MGATRTGGGAAEDRDQHGCHIAPELGLGMAYSLHRACDWEESIMPGRLTRRLLLQLSGASAATGGLAAILASGRAPAYAQGTTVHWLKFVDFVPVSDQLIKGKIKDECQKALGISLHAETIDGNGIQARTTSAIQSGSGPDIIMEINNWPQLYAAITTRPRRSPTTARNGSQCRTRSSPTCWSIVPLGSPISASPPTTSHRRGTHTATLARN